MCNSTLNCVTLSDFFSRFAPKHGVEFSHGQSHSEMEHTMHMNAEVSGKLC